MCQNTTMRVNGAWIKRYCVLSSKSYKILHSCHNFPAGSRQATWGARICETSLFPGMVPVWYPTPAATSVYVSRQVGASLNPKQQQTTPGGSEKHFPQLQHKPASGSKLLPRGGIFTSGCKLGKFQIHSSKHCMKKLKPGMCSGTVFICVVLFMLTHQLKWTKSRNVFLGQY